MHPAFFIRFHLGIGGNITQSSQEMKGLGESMCSNPLMAHCKMVQIPVILLVELNNFIGRGGHIRPCCSAIIAALDGCAKKI